MMKKPLLLFLVLAGIIGAIAVFDTLRNPHLTIGSPPILNPTASDPAKPTPAQQSMNDFMAGADEFIRLVSPQEACAKIEGVNQIFCLQGYFVASHVASLRKVELKEGLRLDQEIPAFAKNNELTRKLWYSSLGMALSQSQLDPQKYAKHIDPNFVPQMLQGWAFYNFTLEGYGFTEAKCTFLYNDVSEEACLFGMGQAAFFNRSELGQVKVSQQPMTAGFIFMQSLISGTEQEASKGTGKLNPMVKVAKVFGNLWLGKTAENAPYRDLSSCIEDHHPLECSKYF